MAWVAGVVAVVIYFLPTLVAWNRNHRNMVPIFLTDMLLGWSGLAWVIALIWSFSDNVDND